MRSSPPERLRFPGVIFPDRERRDTEGLGIDTEGRMYVCIEGDNLVLRETSEGNWAALPEFSHLLDLPDNRGVEALAISSNNDVFAIPEHSKNLRTPFPVIRHRDAHGWDIPVRISRSQGFVPVGADFDAYDRLYLLERSFNGFGFRSRVRRFSLDAGEVQDGEILLVSRLREHDNLEGIGVWQTDDGELRLTLISDDNFNWFQKTEIVEYGLSN